MYTMYIDIDYMYTFQYENKAQSILMCSPPPFPLPVQFQTLRSQDK